MAYIHYYFPDKLIKNIKAWELDQAIHVVIEFVPGHTEMAGHFDLHPSSLQQ